MSSVQQRVVDVAERLLERDRMVSPIGVLNGLGWLPESFCDRWRQGREPTLIEQMSVSPGRVPQAMQALETWARERGLRPTEVEYTSATRDHHPLRFTDGGDEATERAYRTHWLSPELTEKQVERFTERQSRPPELVVVSPLKDWTCMQCAGTGDLLIMEGEGPLCLTCAEMDHLVFLPSGDGTLSRRARKASKLSAAVVRWNRSLRRYVRQGLLVEESALDQAEVACLADEEVRARRRERDAGRRAGEDVEFQDRMAAEIGRVFPGCPTERAQAIARHAGARGSGRVGRSAAGRALDHEAVTLAVLASVRHEDTPYDELLMAGVPRDEARDRVRGAVDRVVTRWRLRVVRPDDDQQ